MLLSAVFLAAASPPLPEPAGASAVPLRAAQSLVLSPAEMFRLADAAIARGDRKMAQAIYAILEQDRNGEVRAEARFRRAKQLLHQNLDREAAVLLRRILDEKPRATSVRLQLAEVLQRLGDTEAALRELRSAQASGLPVAVARLVDRYSEALRASRPAGASLEVAIAPDSNINRATRSDTLGTVLGDFDIDQDSKAKSGIGLALRGQAYRRFALGDGNASILARLSGSADLYGKSSFNDIAADLAVGPELRVGRNRINVELGATQRWFGQQPFMRSARVGATWTRPLGARTQMRLDATTALIDNQFNDLQDGKAFSGQVGIERALSAVMGVAASAGVNRQSLKDPGYSTTGWRASLLGWHEFGRMTLTASGELARLHADKRLMLFPDKRSDRYSRLTLAATFRQLAVKGFAPVVRLTRERNQSSVQFYDYHRTRTEFAIVRAF